jgi:hypothetical protein
MATKTICAHALSYADKVYGKTDRLAKSWKCPCGSGYCKLTASQLLREFSMRPSDAARFIGIEVTGGAVATTVSKPVIVPKPIKKEDLKPTPAQLLVVDNQTMNLVNSVEYPLGEFTHSRRLLLFGVMTVHKVFTMLKQLGYDPIMATPKSVMDVGLASDIAIKWQGGWRLMQIKSSLQYAEVHFEKKGEGFKLHPRISALLPGIDPRRHWDCPECLIIVNGRLVCLNANGKGVFMPPALRADDYKIEKYN